MTKSWIHELVTLILGKRRMKMSTTENKVSEITKSAVDVNLINIVKAFKGMLDMVNEQKRGLEVLKERVNQSPSTSNDTNPSINIEEFKVDYDELGNCVDISQLAKEVERNGDLHDELVGRVADYFGESGIADAVADTIDMSDVIQGVVDVIDYKKLAQAIVISFLADKKIEEKE
jgi:hypothetical protein